jgi:hypothetical protein
VDPERCYEALETLLGRLGVRVRCEPFDPRLFGDLGARGGLCRIRRERVVLVDANLGLAERVGVLAGALARFDLEAVYVPPKLREIIESRGSAPDGGRHEPPSRQVARLEGGAVRLARGDRLRRAVPRPRGGPAR